MRRSIFPAVGAINYQTCRRIHNSIQLCMGHPWRQKPFAVTFYIEHCGRIRLTAIFIYPNLGKTLNCDNYQNC